jgi:hypothetical protein
MKGTMKHKLRLAVWAIALTFLLPSYALAQKKGEDRQKVIDFDDEVVEGMNKRPLDSLSQISEREKRRRKLHLYKKRASFRSETAETLKEIRYIQ